MIAIFAFLLAIGFGGIVAPDDVSGGPSGVVVQPNDVSGGPSGHG
jgi:hypothetical protein